MIEDPPILTVRRQFPRPAPAAVSAFQGAATGFVVDALGGRGAIDYRIKPLVPGNGPLSVFVGVALTCYAGPADNLALFAAIDAAKAGDVLVCATDEFTGASVAGDLVMAMARNKRLVGLVTDGVVRDVEGIVKVGLPVFCAGVCPNSSARNGPGTVGEPVTLGGVTIGPGDVVIGDCNGVVVVPHSRIDSTIVKLNHIRALEAVMDEQAQAGLAVPDFVRRVLESGRVQYLD